jgi:hypothetical protein
MRRRFDLARVPGCAGTEIVAPGADSEWTPRVPRGHRLVTAADPRERGWFLPGVHLALVE